MLCCVALQCTAMHCTTLYYNVLYCTVLYCTVLCCAVLCCAVLCCAVLCCAVLCCAVLCCAVLCCAVLCCAVLCCAVLRSVGLYCTLCTVPYYIALLCLFYVFPDEHSRVKLPEIDNDQISGYINANYIRVSIILILFSSTNCNSSIQYESTIVLHSSTILRMYLTRVVPL